MLNLFIKHTLASLTINENAEPSVPHDSKPFFNRALKENEPYYLKNQRMRHEDECVRYRVTDLF